MVEQTRKSSLSIALIAALAALFVAGPVSASTPVAYAGTAAFTRMMAEHASAMAPTPTFARQTGLACSTCHTQIPELTAFGRQFKLDGYVLRSGPTVEAKAGKRTSLLINKMPALSFMVQTSVTQLSKALPGTQNTDVLLPDQLSLFLGGEITPHMGGFVQLTYDPQDGTIGLDNTDLRFAEQTTLGSDPLTWGLSLNNTPTVQDLWNSTPAWGYPYASSPSAPGPMASTLIDGGLDQTVMGLTGYAMWNNLLYVEFGGYRWNPLGESRPVAANEGGAVEGVAPYWRVALQHQWAKDYLMVGTYGLASNVYMGSGSLTNTVNDLALDAQYEHTFNEKGSSFVAHTTWIHEKITPGEIAANEPASLTLNTFRIDGTVYYDRWVGFTLAPFTTTGTTDPVMYAADPVDGSATGSPDSNGFIASVHFTPWLNTKFTLQYTAYSKFNGGTTNYDGSGRNASDNNTLYFVTWLLF